MVRRPVDLKPYLGLNLLMAYNAALKTKNLQEDRIRVFQGVMLLPEQAGKINPTYTAGLTLQNEWRM